MRCTASYLALVLVTSILCSCTPAADNKPVLEKRDGDFHVSVETNGKEVKNFNEPLVHRVTLSPAELKKVFVKPPKDLRLPFTAQKIFDGRGGVKGVKVTNFRSTSPSATFGLQENDVVTAFGKNHAKSPTDFWRLYQELMKENNASVTLERNGKPHKILFSSSNPEASQAL